ncbi:MAG: CoA transferase, partial [Pseudonocardia sp.]|nr:CoA transferase [Pseudonocardia sp.]
AATARSLQREEFPPSGGRPPGATGGLDHAGPGRTHRLYLAADGWVAVAARTSAQVGAFLGAAGPDPATELARHPVAHWTSIFAGLGVPACRVLPRAGAVRDPVFVAEGLTHVVRDPELGRFRMVRCYLDAGGPTSAVGWPGAAELLAAAGSLHPRFVPVPAAPAP